MCARQCLHVKTVIVVKCLFPSGKKRKKKSINMFNTGRLISETCVSDTVTNSSHAALFSRRIKGIKLSFNLSQKEVQRQHVNELSR